MNKLREWLRRLFLRFRRCEHTGCDERNPIACWHDDPDRPDAYYCPEHAFENGYCAGCGAFWSGIERFDFGSGFCENCEAEIDDFEDEEDDDDALDGWGTTEELTEFESEYDLYRDM